MKTVRIEPLPWATRDDCWSAEVDLSPNTTRAATLSPGHEGFTFAGSWLFIGDEVVLKATEITYLHGIQVGYYRRPKNHA